MMATIRFDINSLVKEYHMRKIFLLSVFLFSLQVVYSQEMKTIDINGQKCVDGHIIVKFKRDSNNHLAEDVAANRQILIKKYKATVKKQWKIGAELWSIDTLLLPDATKSILDSLKRLDFVKYAEPDFIVKTDVIPNDPSFGEQWALNNTGQNGGTPDADIDAPEAWDITTGDTNIVVGVIDSGIDYLHPDLAANIWTNWDEIPDNGVDDDNNGYIDDIHGWDFFSNDNNPMDEFNHGTHVAGIIGAVGNNNQGVAGVSLKVKIMPLRFIGNGWGMTSGAISALEYAVDNDAKITNNSWSNGECKLPRKSAS